MTAQPFERGRTLPARSLEFFFDYTCPFAYVASTQVEDLARRMGVAVTYKPILLGGVFRALGTAQNLSEVLLPAKMKHNEDDMRRFATKFGVPLAKPKDHPMRSVEALRATLAMAIDPKVVRAFYRAYWVDNRPISSPEVVADVAREAGHDPALVREAMERDAIKSDLKIRTDEAIARGIFGVPTYIVDGEHLYWGQDRTHFVEGLPRVASAPGPQVALEAWWDFSSPFGYLGVCEMARLQARGEITVTERPILLGGLFRSIGTPDVPLATFSEPKKVHIGRDLERWAAYLGVPYRFPSRFPTRSLPALRLWYALPEARRTHFRDAVFKACWAEDRDIEDPAVLGDCVGDAEVATEAMARSGSDEVKAALRGATDDAARRGVFGVPTFAAKGELFWGQDRLELALAHARS